MKKLTKELTRAMTKELTEVQTEVLTKTLTKARPSTDNVSYATLLTDSADIVQLPYTTLLDRESRPFCVEKVT